MRTTILVAMLSTTLAIALLGAASCAQEPPGLPTADGAAPEIRGFRHEPGRIVPGRVHRYAKSNLDGSNPSQIALYFADDTRLESLKWHTGEPEATLVVAEMDWEVCSVRRFESFHVDEHGQRSLVAEIETSPDRRKLVGRLRGQVVECALERFPWHSYDFDLASLNASLRFLTDPSGEVEITIVDPVQGPEGTGLAVKGPAFLAYEGSEERCGLPCRRYTIDGPGLEQRGGSLWAAQGDEVFLVAFEIDLPDEPGMSSGKLEWLRNETRSAAEWEAFVRERKDPGAR